MSLSEITYLFIYGAFRNVVFVSLLNDFGKCCVCSVWVNRYFCIHESNVIFFCELYPVCFLVIVLLVMFESGVVAKVVIIGKLSTSTNLHMR